MLLTSDKNNNLASFSISSAGNIRDDSRVRKEILKKLGSSGVPRRRWILARTRNDKRRERDMESIHQGDGTSRMPLLAGELS